LPDERRQLYQLATNGHRGGAETSQKVIDCYDKDSEEWTDAEVGDTIEMKATVKEHSEYNGTKQTVITRPKIAAIHKGE